jgi:hypothetical protein
MLECLMRAREDGAFVRLLRSKIDAKSQATLIHTERGIGCGLRSRA